MSAASPVAPVVVIGIGNPMRGDDGIGPAVIEWLSAEDAHLSAGDRSVDTLVLDGEATRLVEAWRSRERAIVVDAVRTGARAGTITRLDLRYDRPPVRTGSTSSHAAGLREAVDLARVLDALPQELVVFGVEIADVAVGAALSGPVRRAIPELVERIAGELARDRDPVGD